MAESAEPTKMRRRSGLGDFLRAGRRRLDPASLGLAQIRRRTPGLRREEVAERAGIGVDWYVRLEQGRDVSPSPETIDALARALSLDAAEHEHLRVLARGTPPAPFVRESVPDAIRRIVESLEKPAYLSGRRWDVLAWNAAAVRLFTDFGAVPERDRNLLIYVLTDPGVRRLFGDTWAGEARRMVAQFRAAHDVSPDDPAFVELADRLRSECAEFATWWDAHDVRRVDSGTKRLSHPTLGELSADYATFFVSSDASLKLAIYDVVT